MNQVHPTLFLDAHWPQADCNYQLSRLLRARHLQQICGKISPVRCRSNSRRCHSYRLGHPRGWRGLPERPLRTARAGPVSPVLSGRDQASPTPPRIGPGAFGASPSVIRISSVQRAGQSHNRPRPKHDVLIRQFHDEVYRNELITLHRGGQGCDRGTTQRQRSSRFSSLPASAKRTNTNTMTSSSNAKVSEAL